MNKHVLGLILYHTYILSKLPLPLPYLDFPQVTPLSSTSETKERAKKELLTRTSSWSSKGGLRVHDDLWRTPSFNKPQPVWIYIEPKDLT